MKPLCFIIPPPPSPSKAAASRTHPTMTTPHPVTQKPKQENGHKLPTPTDAVPDMWFVEYLTPFDAYHHGVRKLLHASQSSYQSITVADTGPYGRALFLDGKIQTAEGDEPYYHEPLVHTPGLIHGSPRSFLVLGGADGGAAREALRWRGVQRVVVVDIDQCVVDACRQYLPGISCGSLQDPRCSLEVEDAVEYVARCEELFDVIVCDLTDPMEDSPSLALFTVEFFTAVKKRLAPGGALSIQVGPTSLVEGGRLMPRVCATLRSVFGCVKPYQVFVPTYGSPLGMAVASEEDVLPAATDIDKAFEENVAEENVVLDGAMVHGLFALPRCLRKAVKEENEVFTEGNTANAFGKGSLGVIS